MEKSDIVVGKVVGAYGRGGMLKVLPLTDFPDRFFRMDRVTLQRDGKRKAYTVAGVKNHNRHVLMELAEVADMSAAEELKGFLITISPEELTPLPEGSFYIFDLVGLRVYSPEGEYLGVVEDVIQTGANDVYVVAGGEKPPVLVPALKSVVREVDIAAGKMVVDYRDAGDVV